MVRRVLLQGKRLLKAGNGPSALVRFEKALALSHSEASRTREKRALRGLAAAHRLNQNYKKAIEYLERVIQISDETGDHLGDTDALGVIADCYTELDDFELAAQFYDKYLAAMDREGPV